MKYDPSRWKPRPVPNRIEIFEKETLIKRSPAEVFAFCCDGENFVKIFPEPITPCKGTDEIVAHLDHVYAFRHWMYGFFPVRWDIHVRKYQANEEIEDF